MKTHAVAHLTVLDIPQTMPYIPIEDRETLVTWYRHILETGILINGPYTKTFEEESAKAVGVKYALSLNSCTSALQSVLEYINVKGKKVIVPANTFIASSNAVIFAGGEPLIVDIGEDLLMDVEKMKKAVDGDTKAAILVHLAGFIHPQIDEIRKFCREKGIHLIEDAAHAHGASLGGVQAGAFGLAGTFSFYATKVVATGVGGMLTTDDEKLAARVRSVRFHGEDHSRGIQDRLGHDWLMTEFQAALGLIQLRRLPEMVEKRMHIARIYDKAFLGMKEIKTFPLPKGAMSGYYKYPVLLSKDLKKEDIKRTLESEGIRIGNAYWPPIHLQPVYRQLFGYGEGDFPVAEEILNRVISLPVYPGMTLTEVERVIRCFLAALQQ